MQARISKLPDLPPLPPDSEWHTSMPGAATVPEFNEEDEDEQEAREAADALGLLPPGSGMGPPAMRVKLVLFLGIIEGSDIVARRQASLSG